MGFSVSGAVAIVFIGLLVSAATLYPAVDQYVERRADAVESRDERSLTRQNTGIDIVDTNVSGGIEPELTVEVENTGSSTLSVSKVSLLADGEYVEVTPDETDVEGDTTTDVWASGETLTFTVDADPGRVKVVTGPGVSATAGVT